MTIKLRDMVSLSFLVHVKEIPELVRLQAHSLHYVGHDPVANAGLITGIYGANSKHTALVTASNWSRERAGAQAVNRVLMLDTNYRIDNYSLTREQTRRDTLDQTGWLHLDRVSSGFREELKAEWTDWLSKTLAPGVAARLNELSLADLALQYPSCIGMMFANEKGLKGIVHPVNPVLDPTVTLWAATVRYEADRFQGPVIRFLPYVQVET